MPQENSTMSMPRVTSPCASVNTLPCSAVIARASSSRRLFNSSRNLNITRARRSGGVSAQAGNAARALATAASTSEALASETRALTWPVAGLNTSEARPLRPGATLPEIQWLMEATPAAWGVWSGAFMGRASLGQWRASLGPAGPFGNTLILTGLFGKMNNHGNPPDARLRRPAPAHGAGRNPQLHAGRAPAGNLQGFGEQPHRGAGACRRRAPRAPHR